MGRRESAYLFCQASEERFGYKKISKDLGYGGEAKMGEKMRLSLSENSAKL